MAGNRHPRRPAPAPLPVAVTAGEPAGIGPELCLMLARARLGSQVVVVGDRELLRERARRLRIAAPIVEFDAARARARGSGALHVWHVPLAVRAAPGRLDPANSRAVLRTLDVAARGCRDGVFAAMATAPLHKGVINDAGIAFTGHTEYLAQLTGARHVVMMLVGGGMRVALATTHLPLADVARHITAPAIEGTLNVLLGDLRRRFGLPRPRVAVAGLNPHAGESGYLGREEIDVIGPVLARWRARGHRVAGPLPADTLFVPDQLRRYDCVLAMYHDQGLPVLKRAAFGGGVNVTLGLPIVRTSVDHGTALDLAGTGKAHAGSLIEAVRLAARLARPRSGRAAP